MIPRRVMVNLAAFVGLFLLLCLWAVGNVIHLDVIERPWRAHGGVRGRTRPAPQRRGHLPRRPRRHHPLARPHARAPCVVEMEIDRDQDLPEGVTAAIRRKSAVGEPYVALEPPKGYERGGPTIDSRLHHVIPLDADLRAPQLRRSLRGPRRPRRRGAGRGARLGARRGRHRPRRSRAPRCAGSSSRATTCPARWPSAPSCSTSWPTTSPASPPRSPPNGTASAAASTPRGAHRHARREPGRPRPAPDSRPARLRPPGRCPAPADDRPTSGAAFGSIGNLFEAIGSEDQIRQPAARPRRGRRGRRRLQHRGDRGR